MSAALEQYDKEVNTQVWRLAALRRNNELLATLAMPRSTDLANIRRTLVQCRDQQLHEDDLQEEQLVDWYLEQLENVIQNEAQLKELESAIRRVTCRVNFGATTPVRGRSATRAER
jgi:hypothetical protein